MFPSSTGDKSKERDEFFGISGIVKNKEYFKDLGVGTYRHGFPMGISEDVAVHGKRIHDVSLEQTIRNGATPVVVIHAVKVKDEEHVRELTEKVVKYYTTGEGARKIGGKIKYWQIGNEENGGWFTSCSPEEYFHRLRVYASGIKKACPDCVVIMGGLLDGVPGERSLESYLKRFLELGGGEYVDSFDFHFYGTVKPVGGGQHYLSGLSILP